MDPTSKTALHTATKLLFAAVWLTRKCAPKLKTNQISTLKQVYLLLFFFISPPTLCSQPVVNVP